MKKAITLFIIILLMSGCTNISCVAGELLETTDVSTLSQSMQNYQNLDKPEYRGKYFEVKPVYYVINDDEPDIPICSVMFVIMPLTSQMFDYVEFTLLPDTNMSFYDELGMRTNAFQQDGFYWKIDYTPFTMFNDNNKKYATAVYAEWQVPKDEIEERITGSDLFQRELTLKFIVDGCVDEITFDLPELINYNDVTDSSIKFYVDIQGQMMGAYDVNSYGFLPK